MSVKQVPEVASLPPSGEELALLFEAAIQAYVETAHAKPPQRGRAFVESMTRTLADRASIEALWPPRPMRERAAASLTAQRANELYRLMLPGIVAKLPPP